MSLFKIAGQLVFGQSSHRADDADGDYELVLVKDSISNTDLTLRYQVTFGVALIGLCLTALKVFPPQAHPHLLSELITVVTAPILIGMIVAFSAQDERRFHKKVTAREGEDCQALYEVARSKTRRLSLAVLFHMLAIVLFSIIVIIEYQ